MAIFEHSSRSGGVRMRPNRKRWHEWVVLSFVLGAAGAGLAAAQPASSAVPRLSSEPLTVRTIDVDYLQVDGKTFSATIYQPEGPGPFPAILDVHGGAWTRDDVRRDEHALFDKALAAMGMVVAAIDYRQSPQHHYPDSVADVNFSLRLLPANPAKFNS